MKTREKIIIFLIAIILGTISYVYFLDGYYSIDTEWIYTRGIFDYATKDAYIRDGRFFSAIIFILFSFMNLSIKKNIYNKSISFDTYIKHICCKNIQNNK